jgi:low molecular weight protein-tyrosine phosphatase
MKKTTRILFVCTGNICRSPLAEAVLQNELENRGVQGAFEVESAGTDAYHVGEPADPRMRAVARQHGVDVRTRSRQVTAADITAFDYVFAMDTSHYRSLHRFARDEAAAKRIILFRDHDPVTSDRAFPDVPDPWYGDRDGFETVYEIVSRTCGHIADRLINTNDG